MIKRNIAVLFILMQVVFDSSMAQKTEKALAQKAARSGTYTINLNDPKQFIWGLGYEI